MFLQEQRDLPALGGNSPPGGVTAAAAAAAQAREAAGAARGLEPPRVIDGNTVATAKAGNGPSQLHLPAAAPWRIKVAPGEPPKVKPEEVINRITPIICIF